MKKFHISIAVADIKQSIDDYSIRLGCDPLIVIKNEYALWRTEFLNFSIRKTSENVGTLRHVGWEDPQAKRFLKDKDVNGLVWELFNAEGQLEEIRTQWPDAEF